MERSKKVFMAAAQELIRGASKFQESRAHIQRALALLSDAGYPREAGVIGATLSDEAYKRVDTQINNLIDALEDALRQMN